MTFPYSLTDVATAFGYVFSHDTLIHRLSGGTYTLRTFKNGDHNLSLRDDLPDAWQTSCGCATGRRWTGMGRKFLVQHLRRKASRYGLPRP